MKLEKIPLGTLRLAGICMLFWVFFPLFGKWLKIPRENIFLIMIWLPLAATLLQIPYLISVFRLGRGWKRWMMAGVLLLTLALTYICLVAWLFRDG